MGKITFYPALVLLLLLSTPCWADPVASIPVKETFVQSQQSGAVDSNFFYTPIRIPHYTRRTLLDFVSQTRLPVGSLRVEYHGPVGLIVKYSQRRLRKAWSERTARVSSHQHWSVERDLIVRQEQLWSDFRAGGAWWSRSWLDSLEPHNGGAPAHPYVRHVGSDTSHAIGPFTFTNTFKLKFHVSELLRLNTDPDVQLDETKLPVRQRPARLAVDIGPDRQYQAGTDVRFRVRPRVSVGVPRSSDWRSALRRLSIMIEATVFRASRPVVVCRVEARYTVDDGAVATIDAALLTW